MSSSAPHKSSILNLKSKKVNMVYDKITLISIFVKSMFKVTLSTTVMMAFIVGCSPSEHIMGRPPAKLRKPGVTPNVHIISPLNFSTNIDANQKFIFAIDEGIVPTDEFGVSSKTAMKEWFSIKQNGQQKEFELEYISVDRYAGFYVELKMPNGIKTNPFTIEVKGEGEEGKVLHFNQETSPTLSHISYIPEEQSQRVVKIAFSEETDFDINGLTLEVNGVVLSEYESITVENFAESQTPTHNLSYHYIFNHATPITSIKLSYNNEVLAINNQQQLISNELINNERLEQNLQEGSFEFTLDLADKNYLVVE